MLVPRSWLNDFVDTSHKSVSDLADAFNELGLVVEGIENVGQRIDGVVTAKVVAIRKHPDADKIRLVDVITAPGQDQPLQVACGAWNFFEGDIVPLAQLGTTMPDGMQIERRKMRGEWSNGMLCSGRELKLSDDHAGILRLPADTELGRPINDVLGLAEDVVFDLSVEANRPDAMSVLGVARDLAPKIGSKLRTSEPSTVLASVPRSATPRATVSAPDLCDRLTATVVRDVVVAESPAWVKSRLSLAGMRPINNLVDASNYVMLELGAPTHAFDLDRLSGGCIDVRWASPGESVVTLDGVTRTLSPVGSSAADGVIADGGATAVGVAAVMGGQTSEVDATTRNILFEAAHWTPMCIAKTSKRLKLRSEASARFERGTDPEVIPAAVARFIEVIRESSPSATVESYDDIRPAEPARRTVPVRTSRINRVLGTAMTTADVRRFLDPIGFEAKTAEAESDVLIVTIPSWRPDAVAEIDVIEEVGRHFGYGNVERRVLTNSRAGKLTPYQRHRRLVADVLVANGASEVWTNSFVAPADLDRSGLEVDAVRVANPLVAEESLLRPHLLPGLLRVLAHNANHRSPAMRAFEIGHVFARPRPGQIVPYEREVLGVAVALDRDDASSAVALFDLLCARLKIVPSAIEIRAADLPGLHPTRSASIVGAGTGFAIGQVGEVDPDVARAWGVDRRIGFIHVDLENLAALPKRSESIASYSRFPSSDVDLAFVVLRATPAAAVERALRDGAGPLLQSLELFDVYRGERLGADSRGLTYRLRFAAHDRTLTDAELAAVRAQSIASAEKLSGVTLRS